jgi:SAM-dependent methyltransferase
VTRVGPAPLVAKAGGGIWNNDSIRRMERASIWAWVESCREELSAGRVLDYGCGLSPYRALVAGEYVGFDRKTFPGNVTHADIGPINPLRAFGSWDAILCTQVIQFMTSPAGFAAGCREALRPGGHLVLTVPTCWPELEPGDLHRFTRAGLHRLLYEARFTVLRLEPRAEIKLGGFALPLGYGVLACT